MIRCILLLLVATSFPVATLADTWDPWEDRRVVSTNGVYYVVIKRIGGPKVYNEWGPVEYTIVKRATKSSPVKPAKSDFVTAYPGMDEFGVDLPYEIKSNPNVRVRKGDQVLGVGKLKQPPLAIIVSDTGLGFACLSIYGINEYYDTRENPDDAVVIYSPNGKILHRLKILDLFTTKELADFDISGGGLHWLNYRIPGWINEAKQQLVIVSIPSETKPDRFLVRFVDWKTGKVTKGPILRSEKAVKILRSKHLQESTKGNQKPGAMLNSNKPNMEHNSSCISNETSEKKSK